ncbi:MAG: hypothetical protein O2931_01215 [Planctomycetota bacterium]|nr:hypothetical protein [Planctomycetota bacterium]MDA1177392.1 hypothetical protein [Planctomycetota bacterium]
MRQVRPTVAVVTMPTRLKKLRARWGTVGQARFVLGLAQSGQQAAVSSQRNAEKRSDPIQQPAPEADFAEYEREDTAFRFAVETILRQLELLDLTVTVVDREFVPNFEFGGCEAVVVIGQNGLVANVAKYVGHVPIVGVNPDPQKIDGVLLPFALDQASHAVKRVLDRRFKQRAVTLAQVALNDGQRLLAFNDLFVGSQTHVSARYMLEADGVSEPQSSSGILVSTGAGSTGWLSSVFNMTAGVAKMLGHAIDERPRIGWDARQLLWAVREPALESQPRRGDVGRG